MFPTDLASMKSLGQPARVVVVMSAATLSSRWRTRAKLFRDHADESVARAYEKCAEELDEALREEDERLLDLQEAAELSGYSADHLGRLVREEKIPNAGRTGAPRIAHTDLPRKPPAVADMPSGCETTNAQIVQSIIKKGVG